jgi:hypothetical protein
MRRATNIAANNYQVQTEALHVDQRARVAQSEISGKAELDKPYFVTIKMKNTGKTFAKQFTGITVIISKALSDPDPDFDREETNVANSHSVTNIGLIAPNGVIEQHTSVMQGEAKITKDDLNFFRDPTVVLLVFGKMHYWDIFKCEHWSSFCYRAYPINEYYGRYPGHNDADENECP